MGSSRGLSKQGVKNGPPLDDSALDRLIDDPARIRCDRESGSGHPIIAGRRWVLGPRFWDPPHQIVQPWPGPNRSTLVEFGPIVPEFGASSTNIGHVVAETTKFERMPTDFSRDSAENCRIDRTWPGNDQIWPAINQIWPEFDQSDPKPANFDQTWSEFDQIGPNSTRLVRFRPMFGHPWEAGRHLFRNVSRGIEVVRSNPERTWIDKGSAPERPRIGPRMGPGSTSDLRTDSRSIPGRRMHRPRVGPGSTPDIGLGIDP